MLIDKEKMFFAPALPMEDVMDPTGAGDTFAGGFDINANAVTIKNLTNSLKARDVYETFSTGEYATADQQQSQSSAQPQAKRTQPFVKQIQKVGRNSPCPCGSGKKYKQCHGKL